MATFLVARPVERKEHPLAQLRGSLKDGIDNIGCRGIEPSKSAEPSEVEQLVQDEADVTQRCLVGCH